MYRWNCPIVMQSIAFLMFLAVWKNFKNLLGTAEVAETSTHNMEVVHFLFRKQQKLHSLENSVVVVILFWTLKGFRRNNLILLGILNDYTKFGWDIYS